jgi:hypothetical protein
MAILLAGCAGAGGGGGGPSDANDLADDPSRGTLAGVVVDDAIRPVAGASVNVTGGATQANATTDREGRFAIPGLEPGTYVVRVSKEFYSSHEQAVVVQDDLAEPEVVRFQLVFEPQSVPYADLYKFEGFFECGFSFPGGGTNGCANVNIVTGIMLCAYDLPCTNVTSDRSVELIPITPQPGFLQSEMVWEPTSDAGRAMDFGLFAATREELQDGFADGYNGTWGESPLMLQLHGADLEESRIGIEGRQLGIQVSSAWSMPIPVCSDVEPTCGAGLVVQQPYTTYTHAFYGYRPPAEWRFATDGPPPSPA